MHLNWTIKKRVFTTEGVCLLLTKPKKAWFFISVWLNSPWDGRRCPAPSLPAHWLEWTARMRCRLRCSQIIWEGGGGREKQVKVSTRWRCVHLSSAQPSSINRWIIRKEGKIIIESGGGGREFVLQHSDRIWLLGLTPPTSVLQPNNNLEHKQSVSKRIWLYVQAET